MKVQGIKRVLGLLNESELGFYEVALLQQLERHFGPGAVINVATDSADALTRIALCLERADLSNEPVVVFCSTGQVGMADSKH
jgi:hypothetical protein